MRNLFSHLLPPSVHCYLARRIYDLWSMLLTGTGVFVALSIVSYSPNDPSFHTSGMTGDSINNWMRTPGAHISDVMIQTLGIASIFLALHLIIWGIKSYRRLEQSSFLSRLGWVCFGTFFLSISAARLPSLLLVPSTYMGGAFGASGLNLITSLFQGSLGGWEYTTVSLISALVALGCYMKAQDLKFKHIVSFIRLVTKFIYISGKLASHTILTFIQWVRHYNDAEYQPSSLRSQIKALIPEKKDKALSRQNAKKDSPKAKEPSKEAVKSDKSLEVVKPKASDNHHGQQGTFALEANSDWELPALDFLQNPAGKNKPANPDDAAFKRNAEMLQSVLEDFNVSGKIIKIHPGPVVTLYEFEPAPGTKTSRVINLSDDIARSMAALSVRVAVIPGRNVIGIELPNETRQTVYLRELLATRNYARTKAKLPLVLGKDIGGQPVIADLARMPHLLVAGTTGSGKSVAINTMLMSLLYCLPPEQCRLLMIDPKMLELSVYDDIPHLLSPVVTDPGKAVVSLKWVVQEMENRYRAMSKLGVRNIEGYNARLAQARKKGEALIRKVQTGFDSASGKPVFEDQAMDLTSLPYIVVVVDEFADLMLVAGKDVENAIQRLAQMARAAGIHIIMATQRPSVDVITGVVKANFPTRISFHVTSKIDSRTIIGEGGAEQLLGMGDMLYMTPGGRLTRVHGPFVSDQEVEDVVNFLRSQGEPSYLEDITDEQGDFGDSEIMAAMFGDGNSKEDKIDELYDKAVAIVAKERKASTSFIQRHLQIGYNRAARIIEEMEKQGVIGPANHVGKREVLVGDYSEA